MVSPVPSASAQKRRSARRTVRRAERRPTPRATTAAVATVVAVRATVEPAAGELDHDPVDRTQLLNSLDLGDIAHTMLPSSIDSVTGSSDRSRPS
jgi:hypothetical protein